MKGVLTGTLAVILAVSFLPAYAQTDYELLSSRTYTDSAGNFHIVGEIKNITNRTWRFIEVTVPLVDEDDRVLAAPVGFLLVEYLQPGESGAFHILSTNSTQFEDAVAYVVHVNYLVSDVPVGALEVTLGDIVADAGGGARISGEVENQGNLTATQVQVSAALYDVDDNLIDTTVGFTDDIAPGSNAAFTLVSGVRGADDVSRISLNVQSQEYVRVPEFTIPAVVILAGLILAVLLARGYGHRSIFHTSA